MEKIIDWTSIYEQYAGLWVALLDDEQTVIHAAETPEEAYERAIEKGVTSPILLLVQKSMTGFAGTCHEK